MLVTLFANIFLHSVDCLFVLFMVSFAVQKLLSLTRSYLFVFVFISFSLRSGWKNSLRQFMSIYVLCLYFLLGVLQCSILHFRCLVHFVFVGVCGVREYSNFILLHIAVQFSEHYLLKRLSFLHCIFLPPLSYIRWP